MTTSALDKAMRKIAKAFKEYEATVPVEVDTAAKFMEKVREILRDLTLDSAEFALRTVTKDVRESISEIKEMRGQ